MQKHEAKSFPYIKNLYVDNYYTNNQLNILVDNGELFNNLILTGKNGSGKTTILSGLASYVYEKYIDGKDIPSYINHLRNVISVNQNHPYVKKWEAAISRLSRIIVEPNFINNGELPFNFNNVLFSFFKANRIVDFREVTTVVKEDEIINKIRAKESDADEADSAEFSKMFKQFIVNKKVYQAFALLENRQEEVVQLELFFNSFENNLKRIFDDGLLKIEFVTEDFEFFIRLSNGRRITFSQLSSGFSAYLNIVTDLLMRTDIIRKNVMDYSYNPCGIVLIDEPENHMHLEMQYNILPLLVELFPNVQFIVATHSPAVISSIKNATIYDLSSQDRAVDEVVGSSYSELMVTHFGLDNEYSNIVDGILDEVDKIMQMSDKELAKNLLKSLLNKNEKYISAVLRLDLESRLKGLSRN